MRYYVSQNNWDEYFYLDSAGTSAAHEGSSPDHRMVQVGRDRGIPIEGFSRPFKSYVDFEVFDHILCMDRSNLKNISELGPKFSSQVSLITDFLPEDSLHKGKDVPDPYYGGKEGFQFVLNLLEDCCLSLLKHFSMEKKK